MKALKESILDTDFDGPSFAIMKDIHKFINELPPANELTDTPRSGDWGLHWYPDIKYPYDEGATYMVQARKVATKFCKMLEQKYEGIELRAFDCEQDENKLPMCCIVIQYYKNEMLMILIIDRNENTGVQIDCSVQPGRLRNAHTNKPQYMGGGELLQMRLDADDDYLWYIENAVDRHKRDKKFSRPIVFNCDALSIKAIYNQVKNHETIE